MEKVHSRIIRDIGVIFLSIIVAFLLLRSGLIDELLSLDSGYYVISAFIAGIFFTSTFTTPPAIIVLGKLTLAYPPLAIALIGALGAVLGDLLIFKLVKSRVTKDVTSLLSHSKSKRLRNLFKYRFMRWSLAFLGGLIIASPLPEELGLTLMGLSNVSTKRFALISYTFNTFGIMVIYYVASSLN